MKSKRRKLGLVLSVIVVLSLSKVCQAAWGNVETSVIDINVSGSISFVEGPLLFQDVIHYSGWLLGDDVWMVPDYRVEVYIQGGTNVKTLSPVYLYWGRETVRKTDVKCGLGGSYGVLKLNCIDTSLTLTQREY